MLGQAAIEARTHLDLDMEYRSFITTLGGVYVPASVVRPNPFLVARNKNITTTEGNKLTLVNSAYMTRLLFDTDNTSTGQPAISKITSLKPINPGNKPDAWERDALLSFEKGRQEAREVKTINGEPFLRLMRPLVTERRCLMCHAYQGYKDGDIRGGISVAVPLKQYLKTESRTRSKLFIIDIFVWLIGCAGIVGFSRVRQEQEKDLVESEWKFRTVSESTHDWEYWAAEDGSIAYMSPSSTIITGYSPEEFLTKPDLLMEIMHDEDRATFSCHLSDVRAKQHREIEIRIITKDGHLKWIAHSCSPLYKKERFLGRRVNNRDITERKQAEEALIEQEGFSANLIGHSATATFVLDKNHKIMLWNRACEELTGLRESQMIDTDDQWKPFYSYKRPTIADFIIDNDFEELFKYYDNYTKSPLLPQGIKAEGWYRDLGGKDRYIIFEASPIHSSKGKLIAAIETLQDITENKKLEEQLLQSQKLDAIGKLAGGVAHDFNNILTAIMGFSHLTLSKLPEDDPLRGNMDQILLASNRAVELTQGLLSFSRKRIMNPAPHSLTDIVVKLKKFLLRLIREDIQLLITLSEEELTVFVDSGQIEQVLMNLVTNARDALPTGGQIAIRTESAYLDESFAETHGYGEAGRYAVLIVSDTGKGMDAKTRDRIFEPFFTTKEQGKGTGLGLAVVYGIIKQHNGFINVYSEPGKGTSFKIYLPQLRGSHKVEQREVQSSTIQGGSETVLIAEDDAVLRELSSTILRNHGYHVIEAVDGEDVVVKFNENKGRVKLIIFDVIMPKKNGLEAYQDIRRIDQAVKAIFVSGYAEDLMNKEGLLEPGINFISKPIIPSTLLQNVRKVLTS